MQKEDRGPWIPAKTIRPAEEPRSYIVETQDGGMYRRNRRHLRKQKNVRWADQHRNIVDTASDETDLKQKLQPEEAPGANLQEDDPAGNSYRTRSGRAVVAPDRLSL